MILVSQALRQVPCEKYDGVLRDWFKQHADFFMNSPQGKSASTYPNNVGMWYAAGVSDLLLIFSYSSFDRYQLN